MTHAIEVVQRVAPPAKASYLAACAEAAARRDAERGERFREGAQGLSHIPESRVT
jgi:hypothetical protein